MKESTINSAHALNKNYTSMYSHNLIQLKCVDFGVGERRREIFHFYRIKSYISIKYSWHNIIFEWPVESAEFSSSFDTVIHTSYTFNESQNHAPLQEEKGEINKLVLHSSEVVFWESRHLMEV